MADKKMLSTIMKRLDRAIGVLDNCCETGEMSEATRMRLIEMLNSAVMDIYYIGKREEEKNVAELIQDNDKSLPVENLISDTDIERIQENISEVSTAILENNTIAEQQNQTQNSEADLIINDFLNIHNSEQNEGEANPVFTFNSVNQVIENKVEEIQEDILFEIEAPSSVDYLSPQTEVEQAPIVNAVINNIVDDPIEQQTILDERAKLSGLRNQLEDERKRLEEELLSWQKEKIKREEEMQAAERLLAALEEETQRRKNKTVTEVVAPAQSITPINGLANQPQPIIQPQPVMVSAQPIITPNINIGGNHTTTLADKLAGNRQFLHEAYETEELKMQGVTSISDLTKAIGINDKFQFIKELFGGDSDRYTDTIRTLNTCNSLERALNHVNIEFNWDKNNDTVKRMILLIRRRYM